jgi:hypothetical protein
MVSLYSNAVQQRVSGSASYFGMIKTGIKRKIACENTRYFYIVIENKQFGRQSLDKIKQSLEAKFIQSKG